MFTMKPAEKKRGQTVFAAIDFDTLNFAAASINGSAYAIPTLVRHDKSPPAIPISKYPLNFASFDLLSDAFSFSAPALEQTTMAIIRINTPNNTNAPFNVIRVSGKNSAMDTNVPIPAMSPIIMGYPRDNPSASTRKFVSVFYSIKSPINRLA